MDSRNIILPLVLLYHYFSVHKTFCWLPNPERARVCLTDLAYRSVYVCTLLFFSPVTSRQPFLVMLFIQVSTLLHTYRSVRSPLVMWFRQESVRKCSHHFYESRAPLGITAAEEWGMGYGRCSDREVSPFFFKEASLKLSHFPTLYFQPMWSDLNFLWTVSIWTMLSFYPSHGALSNWLIQILYTVGSMIMYIQVYFMFHVHVFCFSPPSS